MANIQTFHLVERNCFISLQVKSKKPVAKDWLNNGKTFEDACVSGSNVGILLGKSSGLLEVDLDSKEAVTLADIILPEPFAVFDRGTDDSRHYLYRSTTFGNRKVFNGDGSKSTLVELRGEGTQTMIPPSVHPNGNKLSFTELNEAAHSVEYAGLLKAVNLLAACSEIAQNWQEGLRHDLAMALSGLARKQDLNANLVMQIVQRICQINNDSEEKDRLNTVRTTFSKPMDDLIGYKGLVKCLGQSLAEAKIKQMTGGDRLKGRPLYGSHIQFNIIGKLWLATNSLPQINNTDHGIWWRIKAIPFNRTFSAEEQDKNLSDKLLQELPGILNWALEGCLAWQNNGLQTPDIVEAQVAEYRISMDSISQFIQDECEVGKDHSYAASKFFQAYRDWCSGAGRKPQSQTAFKRSLEKLKGVYQHRSSNGLQWHGIQPCFMSV